MDLNELILRDIDKKTIWHPYTQMRDWTQWDNKVIVRGSGFYLIDNEGRKYLDGTASTRIINLLPRERWHSKHYQISNYDESWPVSRTSYAISSIFGILSDSYNMLIS